MDTIETTRPQRLIRLHEVESKSGLCRTTIYALIAKREFPAQRKIGKVSVWLEAEIDQWIVGVTGTQDEGNK